MDMTSLPAPLWALRRGEYALAKFSQHSGLDMCVESREEVGGRWIAHVGRGQAAGVTRAGGEWEVIPCSYTRS